MFKFRHHHQKKHSKGCTGDCRTLLDLRPGDSAVIHCLGRGSSMITHRLMEMGVIPGLTVKVERFAPLGEPIEISIGDCHLSLRKSEARIIRVEDTTE